MSLTTAFRTVLSHHRVVLVMQPCSATSQILVEAWVKALKEKLETA